MRKTVCLNMIVKNESHIIEKTLTMLTEKIKFDYWVICDTGSTDNTPDMITNFFTQKNIKGQLYRDVWHNFAFNRTLALLRAYNKSDYVFIFDADDDIVGDVCIPPVNATADAYDCVFQGGTKYNRVQLVNNRIKWEYKSVIHEFISCVSKPDPIIEQLPAPTPYYFVSGRSGSRNQNPNKYLNDAIILEKAHAEAVAKNDPLHLRYAFYCANSYKDHGDMENAIKWYKITLGQDNWAQEKYMSCVNLFRCYEKLNLMENAIYWAVESYKYETQRAECTYELVQHYCNKDMSIVAYQYYKNIQFNYENILLTEDLNSKLFLDIRVQWFMLPYYMIIVCDRIKHLFPDALDCIKTSFRIIFTRKYPMFDNFYINCLIHNFGIFKDKFPELIPLYQSYITFLKENGGAIVINELEVNDPNRKEYKNSNNILIYTGFSNVPWNYTYSQNNALGGSETMAATVAKYMGDKFPDLKIYVAGEVAEETVNNVQYINLNNLPELIKTTEFYCVIVSRYVAFYERYPLAKYYRSIIWAHDISLLPYGGNLGVDETLRIWNTRIDSVVCLTNWHKNLFADKYKIIADRIQIIPNTLNTDFFHKLDTNNKTPNQFIYSSCRERGLDRILELWPEIKQIMPGATLMIASYNENSSPTDTDPTIHYLGKLKKQDLYNVMAKSEYWFYPTDWPETSCITAMEMMAAGVTCVYYPTAGLPDTILDHGIQVQRGEEIAMLKKLANTSPEQKIEMRKKYQSFGLEKCDTATRLPLWDVILNK